MRSRNRWEDHLTINPSLFDYVPKSRAFDGKTYRPSRDYERLKSLLIRVLKLMEDGDWHTLPEIAEATGGSEASVSARLRDLRKEKFGAYQVDKQYVSDGLFRYRLVVTP
jgi:hypothetical protein